MSRIASARHLCSSAAFFTAAERSCRYASAARASSLVPIWRPAGMTRDQPFPFHGNYFFEPVFDVRQVSVGHAAERHRFQWNPIDSEDDLLIRQPHHKGAVGVVLADIDQLEGGVAE